MRWVAPPAAERLGEIAAPTVVLVGDQAFPDFIEIADNLAADIRGARKVVLPDAAHMLALERPDELGRLVGDFLSNVGGAGRRERERG